MADTFRARVAHKRDTSTNWTSANPVLLNGEIIIVDTDAGEVRYKVGDGVKTYTQLPFVDEAVKNLVNSKADKTHVHTAEEIGAATAEHSHSWNDLDDRPFYSEKEIILNTTIEIDPEADSGFLSEPIGLIAGQQYTVTWNGTEYVCTAHVVNSEGVAAVVVGNDDVLPGGVNTGEPFCIAEIPPEIGGAEGPRAAIFALDGSEVINLVVSRDVLKTLDNRYISILEQTTSNTLRWDENPAGLETVIIGENSEGFVRVSDKVLTIDDFVIGLKIVNRNGMFIEINANMLYTDNSVIYPTAMPYFIVVLEDGAEYLGVSFPKKGIYFLVANEHCTIALTVYGYNGFVAEKLNPKYIPGREEVYILPTDIDPSLFDGDHQARFSQEEISAVVSTLDAGGRVYGTCNGRSIEIIKFTADTVDGFHTVSFCYGREHSVYTIDYWASYKKPLTSAVERKNIILYEGIQDLDDGRGFVIDVRDGKLTINKEGALDQNAKSVATEEYVDNAINNTVSAQFITWEADD